MSEPKNNQSAAAAVAGVAARPYTGRSDGDYEGMTAPAAEAFRALDRRLTEGLNLVHGQLASEREERQEGFRQAREERNAGFARLEKLMLEGFGEFRERFARTDAALLKLAGRVSTVEERSAGTRRLVWGILGGLALLIAGGVLRPLFDRAIAELFAGG